MYTSKNFSLTHFNKESGRAVSWDSKEAMIPRVSLCWAKSVVFQLATYALCQTFVLLARPGLGLPIWILVVMGWKVNYACAKVGSWNGNFDWAVQRLKAAGSSKEECGFDRQEEFALTSSILKGQQRVVWSFLKCQWNRTRRRCFLKPRGSRRKVREAN